MSGEREHTWQPKVNYIPPRGQLPCRQNDQTQDRTQGVSLVVVSLVCYEFSVQDQTQGEFGLGVRVWFIPNFLLVFRLLSE
jgi:hypothetical protein